MKIRRGRGGGGGVQVKLIPTQKKLISKGHALLELRVLYVFVPNKSFG